MAHQPAVGSREIIVIGGGVAGAAAALRAAQNNLPGYWLLGDAGTRKASRAAYVRNIDNMIGVHPDIVRDKLAALLQAEFPEAAARVSDAELHISTEDVVGNVRRRIESGHADVIEEIADRAASLARDGDGFRVTTAGGRVLAAPAVVLATGVSDRQPLVHRRKGERDLAGIHWLFPYANQETLLYCIRCEGHLARDKKVAVIGGGQGAAEVALMLRERYRAPVVILTAGEDTTWDQRRAALLAAHAVEVIPGRLTEIHGGEKGAALHGFTLEGGRRVDVDLAFVAMGLYRVANELAADLAPDLEESELPAAERHVLVDENSETSVRGLFAVGDMTRHRERPIMKQVYTAQEYAVRAVDRIDGRRRRAMRRRLLDGKPGAPAGDGT